MNDRIWYWTRAEVPVELVASLEYLGRFYPLREGGGASQLRFQLSCDSDELRVCLGECDATITYGRPNAALRGIGRVLAGNPGIEHCQLKTFGIMLDASRNAVMTVEHFQSWLRQLALLGYNMAMLYTEDTYQLPGEPYFGYMRGGYSLEEIRAIDDCAAILGIELIPCIQTLGHMEQSLQWDAYADVRDDWHVLLVDEDKTYRLIEKMLDFWRHAVRSRRIHVGMDEAFGMGRGRFLDLHGYEPGRSIFERHLQRVRDLCRNHDFRPMIWADMYKGFAGQGGGAGTDGMPEEVEPVFWAYTSDNKQFYLDGIERNRSAGLEPLVATGLWIWGSFWCNYGKSMKAVVPCLEACREAGLKEVFVTLWGDDGAYCNCDSALPGLCRIADEAFGNADGGDAMDRIFAAICGGDAKIARIAAGLDRVEPKCEIHAHSAAATWDDPLMAKYLREQEARRGDAVLTYLADYYATLAEKLRPYDGETAGGDIGYAYSLARFLSAKIRFRLDLKTAYEKRDLPGLAELGEKRIPEILALLRDFATRFRDQWLRSNKPFGMVGMQIRIGGQAARWEEAARELRELAEGKIAAIPELEGPPEPTTGQNLDACHWWKHWALNSMTGLY